MKFKKSDIVSMERIRRLNLINSVTGIKPANLVGTISPEGIANLAIFSSVVHIGSNPALIAFILRPGGKNKRHTYKNIRETGSYTINHVHAPFVKKAHYTSAKFDSQVNEFRECQLSEQYLDGFRAPYVGESRLKMGLVLKEEIPIHMNDTLMIIGQIEHIYLPDEVIAENGYVDLGLLDDTGISGLNRYYSLKRIADFPYARPDELPDFK